MRTLDLYENFDVHHWLEFNPHEGHYALFNPNVVATAFKISELYNTFCNARTLLYSSEVENYGEIIEDDDLLNKTYIKSTLLQSALATYNYCIDLSWQVAWFYCAPDKYYGLIDNEEKYLNYCKECNYSALRVQLELGRRDGLLEFLDLFQTIDIVKRVRSEYNYMKHRGSYYVPGLGKQYSHMLASVDGTHFKMITRNEFGVEDWQGKLIQFDKLFTDYFNKIIASIMPNDFAQTKLDLLSVVSYQRKKEREGHL